MSRLYLHHTVTPFWTGAQAARNVQAIARSRGFVDISYSWLTDRQGNEIEGRGWGRQGAHTVGYNSTSHALSLVGNLEDHPMPAGMIRGAVRLIRRHRPHGPGRITHPHSAVSSTACPGRHAHARIGELNATAAGTSTPAPSPSPSPSPPKKEGFLMALTDKQQDQIYQWAKEAALGTRVDFSTARSGNYVGRDTRNTIKPGVEALLRRHGSTLVAPTDWRSGEPVYLTDFMVKTEIRHGGPLHEFLRDVAKMIGRDPNALRIDRAILDEIPTVET